VIENLTVYEIKLREALSACVDMLARARWEHRESIQHPKTSDATDAAIGAVISRARAVLSISGPGE